VLAVDRGRLPLVRQVTPEAAARLRALVSRRAARVPLQHLTGEAYFRHLTLTVGPGVFVPRPETESVVGWAIDMLAVTTRPAGPGPAGPAGPLCVDLCAGSGAIALALADEVPGARVHAVEADPAALVWLRRNVAATGLPVAVHAADVTGAPAPADGWADIPVLDALAPWAGAVDAVVSNPPYLPDSDRGNVSPEVGEHDPPWALWGGGGDGLAEPRAVVAAAAALLRPGGLFAMEHADDHGAPARALLTETGDWSDVATHGDLAGRDRFVTARRA
jgi:release factor glutamine methyltransferase